jgi:hypothetical protein
MTFLKEILLAAITILGASGLIDFKKKTKDKEHIFSGRTYFFIFIFLAIIFSLVEYRIGSVEDSEKKAFQDSLQSIDRSINQKLNAFDEILYPLQPATLEASINVDLYNPKFSPLASLISNKGFATLSNLSKDSLLKLFLGDEKLRAIGNILFSPEFTVHFYKNKENKLY